jgi:glyoxylate reductase
MKPSIFVTRPFLQTGLDKLNEYFTVSVNSEDRTLEKSELIKNLQNKDALLCFLTDTIDKEVINTSSQLKVISNYAVGYNNIDTIAATRQQIAVCITPGILTNATADLTWALILATTRRIVEADKFTRAGLFKGAAPSLFLGIDLSGKTLGIIGMGRIGQAVAKRARGFEMTVIYHSRTDKNIKDAHFVSLDALLESADIISLHTPLTPATHHLIANEQFKKMKKIPYLINATRGPVIDEIALLEALKTKKIAGAGLDVYEHEPAITPELLGLENVVLLPHIGSATIETRTNMALLAAENAIAVMQGKKPHAIVNPEIII